jgi:hypothetical protein
MPLERSTSSPESNLEGKINIPNVTISKIESANNMSFAMIKIDKIDFPLPVYIQDIPSFQERLRNLVDMVNRTVRLPISTKQAPVSAQNAFTKLSNNVF